MAIVWPSIDYPYEHVAKGHRNPTRLRVRSTFPVEIEELSVDDAPVALKTTWSIEPDQEVIYRDVGGRLFQRLFGTEGRPIADLQELATYLRDGGRRREWQCNPFDPQTYRLHVTDRRGCMLSSPPVESLISREVIRDERHIGEQQAQSLAANLVLIDGSPWCLAMEPVVFGWRGGDGSGTARFCQDADLDVENQHLNDRVIHCFRLDQIEQANAFTKAVLDRSGHFTLRSDIDLGQAKLGDDASTNFGECRYEVMRPEILKFDPIKHWSKMLTRNLRIKTAEEGLKGFESLPADVLMSWAELRQLDDEPYSVHLPARAARSLDALLNGLLNCHGNLPRLIETHATDLAIRGDLLRVQELLPEADDALTHLPAL
ncbi:hypothetical protein [Bosea sp. RAC05]|uniref:hypothetical protein n=1 Tax=Bosea sp. RAC05 TaxID=1842539 RepID=UPI00083D5E7E|nr:hypothetical protein [Bosea sp. RAC05]AOG02857.1 hypothetical protein BSY19_5330 [Bosea sp. RAC05]